MKFVLPALLCLMLTGCASSFSRVDFKYSNLAHMSFRDAMTNVSTNPEEFVFDMSQGFRLNGANILERTRIPFILAETKTAQSCWEADYEILQQEFASYRTNSFAKYKAIDRTTPYTSRKVTDGCSLFTKVVSEADSWFLLVELPPRTSQTTVYKPTIDNFFLFGGDNIVNGVSTSYIPEQAAISVSTRLYIWAWKPKDSQKTLVYLHAKPVSGQLEAGKGNSIGYAWWQLANGYAEKQTVQNYIALIQEYDRRNLTPMPANANQAQQ